jgi:hypothetical protein
MSTRSILPATLKSYIGVESEARWRQRERYFKSGSGKAFAKKRLCRGSLLLPDELLAPLTRFPLAGIAGMRPPSHV